MKFKSILSIILGSLVIFSISCEKKKDTASTTHVDILPLLLPAVQETLPTPVPTALFSNLSQSVGILAAATPLEALSDFFTKSYTGISGVTGTGFIGTSLADLDSRISAINTQFDSEPECFNSTPYEWTISPGAPVSNGTPANYTLTLKLNCLSMFDQANGDLSGVGSGMAWGKDETNYYIALLLIQPNGTDKFGYFATYNRTTKAVDLLFLESTESSPRYTVYRLKTDPDTSMFQSSMAGSNFSEGPMFPALGCNTRIISNGTEMLVAGKAGNTDATGVCQTDGTWVFNSNNCYNPTDLTVAPAACTTLTTSSFSDGFSEIDGTTVFVAKTNLTTNLTFSNLSGNVQASK